MVMASPLPLPLLFLAVAAMAAAPASAQEPNTDAYFVSQFFSKMGAAPPGAASAVCSWAGVTCADAAGGGGGGRVVGFAAAGLGLSGPIPENTIGKLGALQFLDLSRNRITAFSTDMWELGGSLRSLNLSGNSISGELPSNVGDLGRLQVMDLSHNAFSGEVPPALGSIAGLVVLNASHNRFQGQVPGAVVLGCKNLAYMDLSANAMDGFLPDLSPLAALVYLNLSGNRLQGSVLGAFQESLQAIDLSKNRFSEANLSSSYRGASLAYLDLSSNELAGEFSFAGRFQSLRHINLGFNRLSTGDSTAQLAELYGLEYLNLSRTGLSGHIPIGMASQLVDLKVLDLSQNYITGQVPDLSSMKLQVLDLSVNNLTGEIPEALVKKLASMERFNFSYNNLTVCASELSPEAFAAAFAMSRNDCPIAVNPDHIGSRGPRHRGLRLALAVVLSLFFSVLGLLCLASACRRRKRGGELLAVKQVSFKEEPGMSGPFAFQTDSTTWVADVKVATSVPVVIFEKPLLSFTFADLLAATSNFDRGTLLAEGRFGPVYRGFLPGGVQVAVKVLLHGSAMADQDAARELERLGRIKHPNLVPLSGYCLAGDQRIAIYEYMENGNLQNLLHDLPLGVQTTEDWSTDTWEDNGGGGGGNAENISPEGAATWRFRHRIALGAARALAFLHHGCIPQIVHRDVKASSIYFDAAMEPRLSDFGLSMIAGTSPGDDPHHSPGYAPPEFSDSENAAATTKSDVFGFGVVLFELITGKKPLADDYPGEKEASLVQWARAMVKKGMVPSLIDAKIRATGPEKQMEEALRIAYLCTADSPAKRPAMQQIVGLLKDIEPKAET